MDSVITNRLVKTENGDLVEKVLAQIVNKEINKITI